ncbi:hypothetical protein R1sor_014794 [Riccia sorocarpa]|uniref:DUF676 domain-containing protein n=1 Tax=Riccia sorocarpa TaxID=122646 RepID=A0ABD3HAE5_9MARC
MSTSDSAQDLAIRNQLAEFKKVGDYVYSLKWEDKPEAVIVFFHGLVSTEVDQSESEVEQAFWSTWTERNSSKCWPITMLPTYLKEEKKVEDYRIRILAMSYESRVKVPDVAEEGTDNYLLAEAFTLDLVTDEKSLCRNKTDNKDIPIILVGHDMGGILIKNFILKLEHEAALEPEGSENHRKLKSFLENLKAVIFYATPHSGSQAIMDRAKSIKEDTDSLLLQLMRVLGSASSRIKLTSPAIGTAKRWACSGPDSKPAPSGGVTKPIRSVLRRLCHRGFKNVMVVEEGSARHDIDSCNYYSVPRADHFQVCQPEGTWSKSLKAVGDKVHEEISKCRQVVQEKPRNSNKIPQNTSLPSKEGNVTSQAGSSAGVSFVNYTINLNVPAETFSQKPGKLQTEDKSLGDTVK